MKKAFLGLAMLAALAAAGGASAGSRIVFGLHFGLPLYGHWPHDYYYAPYPYYYYPPPVYYYPPPPSVIYAPPPTVESSPPAPPASQAPAEQFSWHYCPESRGYYPYVRECPGGWQRVPAAPPGQ